MPEIRKGHSEYVMFRYLDSELTVTLNFSLCSLECHDSQIYVCVCDNIYLTVSEPVFRLSTGLWELESADSEAKHTLDWSFFSTSLITIISLSSSCSRVKSPPELEPPASY